jgi:RNA polymerase sigma-70 factor (ECF subfamily)
VDFASLEDRELLLQMEKGQEEALAALYDRYSGLVFSVALRIVHDPQSAEEITLDIFRRVWRSGHTYRSDRGKVSTWLAGMARNLAVDQLRRENARPQTVSLSWVETADKLNPTQRSPESAVHLRVEQERVRKALAQLPPEQQEALALAYFGGFSQSEISARLQQPLGTVKTRIRLAMQKLRYLLHDG